MILDSPMSDGAVQAEKVQMLLDGLVGLTTDEIADVLQVQGVRGICGHASRCAIAVYLERNGVHHAEVSRTFVHLPGSRVSVPLSVRYFIRDFDEGHYPDLCWLPPRLQGE